MSVYVVKRLQDGSCAGVFSDVNYAKVSAIEAVNAVWGASVCEWEDKFKIWVVSDDNGYVIFTITEFPVLGGTGKITV